MGKGPAPPELLLLDWGRPYGKLPPEFDAQDYQWLALASQLENLRRLNALWENPQTAKSLPKDVVLYIFALRKEVKEMLKGSDPFQDGSNHGSG